MKSSGLPPASSGAASATASSSRPARLLGLGEVAQHVAEHALLGAGVADAEAHPPVVRRAEQPVHAAQAVVPRRPAAPLHAHLAGRQVELVVEGVIAAGSSLKNAAAACTLSPDAFM